MRLWPILSGALHLATRERAGREHRAVGGACDAEPARAALRADAEALERLTLLEQGPALVRRRADVVGVPGGTLVPHPALDDDPWWVVGRSAAGDVAVPASVALLGWRGDGRPLRWKQSSVGTAAHPDGECAATTALLECLERHAVRRVWHGSTALAPADALVATAAGPRLDGELRRARLHPRAWLVATDLPVVVALVAVTRSDRQQITFGACARLAGDEVAAVRHALHEAISVRAALAGDSAATETAAPRRLALRQDEFLRYLEGLVEHHVTPAPPAPGGLEHAVEERFGVPVVRIPLPTQGASPVVRVVVPHEDFLVPRDSHDRYALAPGYIE